MYDIYDNDFDKAFDEAVEAIEKKEHRLIWADDLKAAVDTDCLCLTRYYDEKSYLAGVCDVLACVDAAPTIEAESVKHGRWKTPIGYPNVLLCSECNTPYEKKEFVATPNYCPNCGADMRGGDAE